MLKHFINKVDDDDILFKIFIRRGKVQIPNVEEVLMVFFFRSPQMVILPELLHHMVTMRTEQRSSGGTMTSCRTSTTHHHPLHTSVPKAVAAGTHSPQDHWSPPSRSVTAVDHNTKTVGLEPTVVA